MLLTPSAGWNHFFQCFDIFFHHKQKKRKVQEKCANKNMATFIVLRHPVTILVTAFTNPDNLTNDLFKHQPHLSYAIAILKLLQYSTTLGVPDSIYARFNIISDTCHPAPCYWNSDKVFQLLSDQYCNPERGFEPWSSSECLLEFETCVVYFDQLSGATRTQKLVKSWNHWKSFEINKKVEKRLKKKVSTSFRVRAAPEIWTKYTTSKKQKIYIFRLTQINILRTLIWFKVNLLTNLWAPRRLIKNRYWLH